MSIAKVDDKPGCIALGEGHHTNLEKRKDFVFTPDRCLS